MVKETTERDIGAILARLNHIEENLSYIRDRIDAVNGKVYSISGAIAVVVSLASIFFSKLSHLAGR